LAVVNWCPLSCQYCTRSYEVGAETDYARKDRFKGDRQPGYDYIRRHEEINDVVVSGGDTYQLAPTALRKIGLELLDMPHIRYVRFATRGLAAAPSRILNPNDEWTQALKDVASHARKLRKEICLHTHINHPNELSWMTKEAVEVLDDFRIKVRNQAVLLRGVNDSFEAQYELARQTSDLGIEPVGPLHL
jgi:lysine 2,3-aminomutase